MLKCLHFFQSQSDLLVLHNVARILELSVPLMDHPSEGFLAQLEEDMMKLILKHGMMVSKELVAVMVLSISCVSNRIEYVKQNVSRLIPLSFLNIGLAELCELPRSYCK